MSRGTPFTVTAELVDQTDLAWLIWDGSKHRNGDSITVWVPKSLVERDPPDGETNNDTYEFTMPEWLADDKGLM